MATNVMTMALGPDPINMTCPKCQANIKTKIETSTSGKGWAIGIGLCLIGYVKFLICSITFFSWLSFKTNVGQ